MDPNCARSQPKLKQRFRFCFRRWLTNYQSEHDSGAQGFGIVWEKTLEEVPIDEEAQGQLYRELISWAKSAGLFKVPTEASKAVRVADDDSGLAMLVNGVSGTQDYSRKGHRVFQEFQAEIRQFRILMHCRGVLSRHASQLTNDLRVIYAQTQTVRLTTIS